MAFPFTYKKKIELFFDNDFEKNKVDILYEITKKFAAKKAKIIKRDKENMSLTSKNSLFSIEYPIDIFFGDIPDNYFIEYTIDLDRLIKITFLIVIFLAFFSFLSVSGFLIYSVIFIIAFYIANLFFINSFVERIIYKITGENAYDFTDSETLSKQQNEWINNPKKCSGCGYILDDLVLDCPECGLKIRKNRYSVPLDTSKYENQNIKYHYKEK